MSKDPKYKTVAEAIRVELDDSNDDLYLVFKIVDEQFKQKIRADWNKDIELVILGTKLKEKE